MVDIEVENTLREIRERVRATALEKPPVPRAAAPVAAAHGNGTEATTTGAAAIAADELTRLEANLATVERTWNRLPPLLSNRQGWVARLELWIKRKIKRATHWYTWEQVNFNAAVFSSLREMSSALREVSSSLAALSVHEHRLAEMESAIAALRQTGAEMQTTLSAQNVELRNSLASAVGHVEQSLGHLRRELEDARREADRRREAAGDALRVEFRNELRTEIRNEIRNHDERYQEMRNQLLNELRERIEHVTDEQRVSFKQLSLEASENAVLSDRARRRTDLRLEEIAARLEELRKAGS